MNTQSELFQELTQEEISRITQAHFPGSGVGSYRLLDGGLFNTTYLLTLTDSRRLVLRVGPVNPHLLMGFERTLMQGEVMVNSLFHRHGIPTSSIAVCDTSRKLLGRDYMLVDYIDSVPLNDPSILEPERDKLYEQAGRCAANIHSITGPLFGRASEIATGGGHLSWLGFLRSECASLSLRCLEHNVFREQEALDLCSVFDKKPVLFEGVNTPFWLMPTCGTGIS